MVKLKIAAKSVLLFLLVGVLSVAYAKEPVAKVLNLAGVMTAQNELGQVRFLAQDSQVELGDTLTTQEDSFAQLKFTDGAEVTIKPDTIFSVDRYRFDQGQPQSDSMEYSLIKGGMRAVTGLIGKRNPERYQGKAVTAVIGVRGTDFEARVCMADCAGVQDGLYTQVFDGVIITANVFGSLDVGAGQFGFASATAAPVLSPVSPDVFIPLPKVSSMQSITAGGGMVFLSEDDGQSRCQIK